MVIIIRTTKLRRDVCSTCQTRLDAATSFGGEAPRPGDLTVCAACGEILIFDAALRLALYPAERMAELSAEMRLQLRTVQEAVRTVAKGERS